MTTRNLEAEFDTVKDDLVKLRADIASLTHALKDASSETVQERLASVRERVSAFSDDAKSKGLESIDDLVKHVEEKPLSSILIAFGVGLLAGRLLDR